ncbi:MAG: hypothetical protein L0H63_03180, partial [Nitrococcus sp.]|nr:hypothetical protein [Nitrococcus sp.]
MKEQDKAIKALEKRIKDAKAAQKTQQNELTEKLELKRVGGDAFKAENRQLIAQIDARLQALDPASKADKKTINALD